MKKGDLIEGVIEEITFPNKGIFHAEGIRVSVKGVLPGATVRVRIKKKRQDHAEAILLDTITESPLATKKPVCPHFYECGGCTYQNIAYTNQLRLKEKMVKDLLLPVVPDLPWEGILPSPEPLQYRNKMEFTFGDAEKDGPLTLGLHRQGSTYDVLEVKNCAIVRPAWNEILKYTQKFFREHKVNFYHKMQHYGILRHLVVRQSFYDGGILVNLVTTTKHELPDPKRKAASCDAPKGPGENSNTVASNSDASIFNELPGAVDSLSSEKKAIDLPKKNPEVTAGLRNEVLQELHLPEYVAGLVSLEASGKFDTLTTHSHLAGVLYTENDNLSDAVVCDSLTKLYGDDYLMEEVLGLKFKISPFSFFQTNTRGCEVLYSKVREYVLSVYEEAVNSDEDESSKNEENLSKNAKDSLINEKKTVKKAGVIYDLYSGTGTIAQLMAPIARKVYGIEIVEEAVEAAKENAKLNKLGNCEFIAGDVLAKLDEIEEKPDFIILDPPREGCTPKALNKIISYGVPYMVYISCKPTSLAEDLVALQKNGYKVIRACAVDEFPNTQHVETICLLGNKSKRPDDRIQVRVDADQIFDILEREKEEKLRQSD